MLRHRNYWCMLKYKSAFNIGYGYGKRTGGIVV
jgi:hypothetical protein